VGLYALTLMEREGAVHGYGLSERIAQRTEGGWRPGPGSVYPSLAQLVRAGLARSQTRQRRREYSITDRGRTLLRQMRQNGASLRRPRPDLSALWAEVVGPEGVDRFLLLRLRRTLDSIEAQIARASESGTETPWLWSAVQTELAQASARFNAPRVAPGGTLAGSRRVRRAR